MFNILDIKLIGDSLMIIKMADKLEVVATKGILRTTYGGKIEFVQVSMVKPAVKISRIYCDNSTVDDIKEQVLKQNKWIPENDFNIVEQWITKLQNEAPFATLIVESSLETHAILLNKGFIIYGLKKSAIREHVKVIQCGRCWRYGHTGFSCKENKPLCRKCGGDHVSSQCQPQTVRKRICVNCNESNAKGTTFDINHAPNDDRCPRRIERINGLKHYFKSMMAAAEKEV